MIRRSVYIAYLQKHELQRYNKLLQLMNEKPDQFERELETDLHFLQDRENDPHFKSVLVGCDPLQDTHYIKTLAERVEDGQPIYVREHFNQSENRQLCSTILKDYKKATFIISPSSSFRGKLVNQIKRSKAAHNLSIVLTRTSEDGTSISDIHHFDRLPDKRKYRQDTIVSAKFWSYQFTSNDQDYLVLSEDPLDLGNCIVKGLVIELEDNQLIGQSARVKVKLPILIAYEVTHSRPKFESHEDLIQQTKQLGLTIDKLGNYVFSKQISKNSYRHPTYFEWLVYAFLFSGKLEYPLHLLIIAPQGTGKSVLEETLSEKFEDSEIIEGSSCTLKALIPSFKRELPDAGALLKAEHICFIDEFLRILLRVDQHDRQTSLAAMNPILEHKHRRVGSGNGELVMNPTARVLAVTNPIWGTRTMEQLCSKFDRSFVSRFIVWYQDSNHIKHIQDESGIEKAEFNIGSDLWMGVVTYFHSFISDYDEGRVKALYLEGLALLGDDTPENLLREVRSVYSARYRHHLRLLLDGIVKTRCLCSGDSSFIACDEDYGVLRVLLYHMLSEWGVYLSEIDKSSLSIMTKLEQNPVGN